MTKVKELDSTIKDWVTALISEFRAELQKLSEQEQAKIGNLDDFSPPCQAEVIWLSNPDYNLDQQLMVVTHFSDIPDFDVRIWGPIAPWNFEKQCKEILTEPKWNRALPSDAGYLLTPDEGTYATLLEDFLVRTFEDFRNRAQRLAISETKLPARRAAAQYLSGEAFCWFISGTITEVDRDEIIARIIKDAKVRVAQAPKAEVPKPQRIKGYGTFFYPSIWVGDLPKQTLADKLRGHSPLIPGFSKKAVDTEYKGHKLVVNSDGFIAIGVDNKAEALELLNEIMVAALLAGIPSYAIRELELGECEIDPDSNEVTGTTMPLTSMRTRLVDEQWPSHPSMALLRLRRKILIATDIMNVIENASVLTADVRNRNVLKCFLEAYTHLQNSEHAQCIVMAWVAIETEIERRWENLIVEKSIGGKRRDKLCDSARWDMDTIIETLNISGLLANELYTEVMQTKRKRNAIVHDGDSASAQEARDCLDLLSELWK